MPGERNHDSSIITNYFFNGIGHQRPSGYKADSYPGRLETRDRLRFLGGLACEEVLQDIFAIRRGERLLANFTTQQVIKRLGLRLYPYHLVVRSTLRTGEAGGIVMHRYQARSGSSHHLPLSCSSVLDNARSGPLCCRTAPSHRRFSVPTACGSMWATL